MREDDNSKEGTPVAGTPKLGTNGVDLSSLTSEEKLVMALEEESRMATEARACTGRFYPKLWYIANIYTLFK